MSARSGTAAKRDQGASRNGGPYLPERPRTVPYRWPDIQEVPCLRCGGKSKQQWTAEILGEGNYWAICNQCELLMNKLLLRFFDIPDAEGLLDQYREKLEEAYEEDF